MKYSAALKSAAVTIAKSMTDTSMYHGIGTGILWVFILAIRVCTFLAFPLTLPLLAYAHKRDVEMAPMREKKQRERMQAKVEELRTKLQRSANG